MYWPTGSACPAARVCFRASSAALTKSGNHGISTPHARRAETRLVLSCRSSPWKAGHEHVLRAVVAERLAREAAVERFYLQARDVQEAQPFVPGGPPRRRGSAAVDDQVDPV